MTYLGAHDETPPVRGSRSNPSKTSPCSRCQHAEFVHAYAGPCLFHDCECPFFIPEAEPDVEEEKDPAPDRRAPSPLNETEPR